MSKGVSILLVEDNEGDVVLTLEALREARIQNEIAIARDGEAAIAFLNSDAPLPDLIFLDINLPRMDGLEVLANIKNDDRYKMIPVIMLTTSTAQCDVLKSYANHANCFIEKPVGLARFMEVVKMIENFWISIVKLPQIK